MKLVVRFILLVVVFNLQAKIQLVPVDPTPQPENTKIYIVYPEKGQMLSSENVWVQVKLRGFPLGNMTENDRGRDIANSPIGQSVHIVIDNNIYFARTGTDIAPYNEDENYYEAMFKFQLPMKLSQGKHYIRVFPARSYGESLKEDGSFAASYFYVDNTRDNIEMDLSQPYLTYNEPSGYMDLRENQPILLDFYVSNCELSADGYQVKATIDTNTVRNITSWRSYYINDLSRGKHTIRLQLVDKKSQQVPGVFNDVTTTFRVD